MDQKFNFIEKYYNDLENSLKNLDKNLLLKITNYILKKLKINHKFLLLEMEALLQLPIIFYVTLIKAFCYLVNQNLILKLFL